MLSFDVSGAPETLRRLETIERTVDTTPPLSELNDAVLPILRLYPPERPGQRYTRTGRLGRGWRGSAAGQVVTFENPVEYAGAVYGDGTQAAVHAGRWPRMTELRGRVLPVALNVYREWIERLVRG